MKVNFGADKVLGRPAAPGAGMPSRRTRSTTGVHEIEGEAEPFLDGCRHGQVWGTMWHGAFENDDFRRCLAGRDRAVAGRSGVLILVRPATRRDVETMINKLADAVERYVDLALLLAGTRVAGAAVTIRCW